AGWGCEVAVARSLAEVEALAATAHATRPEIVLADCHLDGGDTGIEAVRALRRQAGRELPGIIITADRTQAIAEAAAELGCELLLKPVKPAALRALMQHLLAHPR